jgi:voltage-gated potassium channel
MTRNRLKEKVHEIIFEADTPMGKLFDVVLLIAILLSVIIVMLESVPSYSAKYHDFFIVLEWIFTFIFTIEYILRLYAVYRPLKYATSFFGIVDLVSILPTYLAIVFAGSHSLMIIRGLRLLRVFRIFKLANFLNEGQVLITAMKASRTKITVFLIFILILVSIFGSLMYLIEGRTNAGFDSIPRSIYWAIVTLTTVGYGDISPQSTFGQFMASIIMLIGYAVIAVPTGIVTNEVVKASNKTEVSVQACRHCSLEGQAADAIYCKHCGEKLNEH